MLGDWAGETPVLLFDGDCGLCSATVRFILRHERRAWLRFAPLQSPFAERLLSERPRLRNLDSMLWLEPAQDRVFAKSAAALRVADYLGGGWRLALLLSIVPRPLRDAGYDFIARHRHRMTAREARCIVPPRGKGYRFLDHSPKVSDRKA